MFTVKEAAQAAGIRKPYALMQRSGLEYKTCRKLWSNKIKRIDPTTLAALCFALGCAFKTPLMRYEPPRRPSAAGKKAAGKKPVKKTKGAGAKSNKGGRGKK